MARPTLRILISLTALVLIAAACGDDGGTAATQAESPNTEPFASTTEPPTPTTATTAAPTTTTTAGPTTTADPNRVVVSGDSVSVHYVGTLDSGEQFDSSRDRGQPLSFDVGSRSVIAGFDAAVLGMKIGDVKTVRIEVDDAYGPRVDNEEVTVPVEQLPENTEVGQVLFNAGGQQFTVLEIGDVEATLEFDPNHPLAGEALTFEIELVSFNS